MAFSLIGCAILPPMQYCLLLHLTTKKKLIVFDFFRFTLWNWFLELPYKLRSLKILDSSTRACSHLWDLTQNMSLMFPFGVRQASCLSSYSPQQSFTPAIQHYELFISIIVLILISFLLWLFAEPYILGELGHNTTSLGWRKNYPWYMVHFIFFLGIKLFCLSR